MLHASAAEQHVEHAPALYKDHTDKYNQNIFGWKKNSGMRTKITLEVKDHKIISSKMLRCYLLMKNKGESSVQIEM